MSTMGIDRIDNPSLALCLSGGGLRATLFHLGVIKALRDARIDGKPAIAKVNEIYSVSGGSILAAHLVVNWAKYCGTDDEFESVAKEIRQLASSDIRGRVLQRWLLSLITVIPRLRGASRTFWLAAEYESLFGKVHLARLYKKDCPPRPKLYVLTTSFRTGELCSFSPNGFEIARRSGSEPVISPVEVRADLISLSFAVAASSAFPPLFPPVRLTGQMLGDIDSSDFQNPIHLSDGGVFDNLGVEKLLYNKTIGKSDANVVVLSNAGSSFKSEVESSFSGVFSRNVRASDIMMRRIAESTDDKILRIHDVVLVDVRIGKTVIDSPLLETTQQRMRGVRTDLDRFPPILIEMLVEHGYQVGKEALRLKEFNMDNDGERHPVLMADPEVLDIEAKSAAQRAIWRINFQDWATYVLMIFFASILAFLVASINSYFVAKKAAKTAEVAKLNAEVAKQNAEKAERAQELIANGELKARADASDQHKKRVDSLQIENAELRRRLALYDSSAQPIPMPNKDYKVWIQFAGLIKREEMVEFGGKIKQKWPQTPGASRGGERTEHAMGKNEVRFGPDADRNAARQLADDVKATGIVSSMKIEHTPGISPGSLEIWLSR